MSARPYGAHDDRPPGELAPASVLVESELCQLLGVSRTPLREALNCWP